jgi:hypothetical protein
LDSFGLTDELGNLPFTYWSPSDPSPSAEDTLFVDGGDYENVTLISFLQRRVSKIALFILTDTPLTPSYDYNPYGEYLIPFLLCACVL